MASDSQARRAPLTRRQILAGMSALGAMATLAACGGSTPAPTATTAAQGTSAPRIVGTQNPTAIPQVGATSAAPAASSASGAPTTAAAAQPTTSAASAAVGSPVAGAKGGTIKFPVGSDPIPNPITVAAGLSSILGNKTMFNGLIRYNSKTLNPEGDLAEKWEIAPDGLSITFTLRQGVKWHDGQPFTADDVKFTFDTMLDPKVNANFRSNIKGVTAAVVNSPSSVTLKLANPLPSLPIQLGYNIHMVPKHLLSGQDINAPKEFLAKPIGTGPFKFLEATPGSTMTVERNDNFHFGAPLLDKITFVVRPDLNAQLAQLKTGELDFMLMEPDIAATVKNDANIIVQNASQVNYYFIAFNNKKPPFTDKLVRQALAMAIDRDSIVKNVLGGAGVVANGPINPLLASSYTDDVKKWPYDPKAAGVLLDSAGWKLGADGIRAKDGQKLAFELITDKGNTSRESIAQIAQQAYKAIGADVKINVMEFNASLVRYRVDQKNDFEAIVEYYITAPDPDVYAFYATGGSQNNWNYSSPQADDLLTKARSELDPTKRGALYKQFLGVVAEDQPMTFLYYPQEIRGLRARLQNVPTVGIRDAIVYSYQWSIKQ